MCCVCVCAKQTKDHSEKSGRERNMVGAGQTPSVLFLQNTHVAVLMYYGGLSAG